MTKTSEYFVSHFKQIMTVWIITVVIFGGICLANLMYFRMYRMLHFYGVLPLYICGSIVSLMYLMGFASIYYSVKYGEKTGT